MTWTPMYPGPSFVQVNFEANDLDPHVSWAFICTSKLHVKYNYTYIGGF